MEINDKDALIVRTTWQEYCDLKHNRLVLKAELDDLKEKLYNLSLKTNEKKEQYDKYVQKVFGLQ